MFAGITASVLMLLYQRPASPVKRLAPASDGQVPERRALSQDLVGTVGVLASFSILAGVAGARHGIGTDYVLRYVPLFENIAGGWHVETEYGFRLLTEAVAAFTDDYRWFFAVTSVLTVGLVYRFILRLSFHPALSVFVYVFGGFYLESFNLTQQALAIAIVLNTIEFALKRKVVPFVVITLLAATVHSSALLWLLVWPFVSTRRGPRTQMIRMVALGLGVLFLPATLGAIATRWAPEYAWYFQSDYGFVRSFDPGSVVIAGSLLVLSLLVRGPSNATRYRTSVLGLQGLQIVTLIASLTIAYAYTRVAYYFTPIQMLALPMVLAFIRDARIRAVVAAALVLLYVAAFYYKFVVWNAHGVLPYESVF